MLRLNLEQRAESLPDLRITLGEGLSYRPSSKDFRVLALSAFIDNLSSSDDSARADLEVRYTTPSSAVMTVKLQHDPGLAKMLPASEIAPLVLPKRVPSLDRVDGWMLFSLADAIVVDADIDGYRLTVYDTCGLRDAVETVILREIVDEKDLTSPS